MVAAAVCLIVYVCPSPGATSFVQMNVIVLLEKVPLFDDNWELGGMSDLQDPDALLPLTVTLNTPVSVVFTGGP